MRCIICDKVLTHEEFISYDNLCEDCKEEQDNWRRQNNETTQTKI